MKFFTSNVVILVSVATIVSAAPAELQKRACTNPVLRKNWNSATTSEQTNYVNAVKCLATKPSVLGTNATLYDDFTVVHRDLDRRIHGVASFLPWHRYFIQVYEDKLKQCGYTGALLYWDWEYSSNTYSDIRNDPIFSASSGIGGDGLWYSGSKNVTGRCLTTGAFTELRPVYWDLQPYLPHCVTRQFYDEKRQLVEAGLPDTYVPKTRIGNAEQFDKKVMDSLRANSVFSTFAPALENGPHAAAHGGVGGEMRRVTVSTNDPLFFLHHTNVDRLWWQWQQQDLSTRAFEITGKEQGGVAASLDYALLMNGLAPTRSVRDFMVSNNDYQCFKY